jgi:glycosyltransferase involved in cell wall biosynthesis
MSHCLVSVIIPFHNRFSTLSLSISELERQSFDLSIAVQVIVVDSKTEPRSLARLSAQYNSFSFCVDVFHVPNNVSVKRNHGASFARGSVLIFIDDDCIPESNFLYDHVSSLRYGVILSGQVSFDPAAFSSNFVRFRDYSENRLNTHLEKSPLTAHHARSMNFSMYRSLWRDNSLSFDEQFRGYGWEDPVFFSQCIKKGLIIYPTSALVLHHDKTDLRNYRLKIRQFGQWYRRVFLCYPDLAASLWFYPFARFLPFFVFLFPFLIFLSELLLFLLLWTDKSSSIYLPYLYRILSCCEFLIGYVQSAFFGFRNSFLRQPLA